jgi:hypothetical protein
MTHISSYEDNCDRMCHIILSGSWHYSVFNVLVPNKYASYDTKENLREELYQFSKHQMNILLGDLNVKLGKEDAFNDNCKQENP